MKNAIVWLTLTVVFAGATTWAQTAEKPVTDTDDEAALRAVVDTVNTANREAHRQVEIQKFVKQQFSVLMTKML